MKSLLKKLLRIPLILLALASGLTLLAAVAYWLSDRSNGYLVSSGVKRKYLLYVPKSYDPARPVPLVISIHGYSEWPAHQMQISCWNDLADQYGFIVVYPSGQGLPKRWRIGGIPNRPSGPQPEVTFISDLIDHLAGRYNIDPVRIYANGFSNGGGLSFVLSCQLSERIAAFGSVAGAYLLPWSDCQPARPVPAILFHGTADPVVPYQGGPSRLFNLPFPSIPAWVAALAQHIGCTGTPQGLPVQGQVSGVRYANSATGVELVFYTIADGGHAWPGGKPLPKFIVGHTPTEIDATRTMWAFFQQHPLPGKKQEL
ncbi:MAG: PHB depolymerase family esterase [Anaerolineales bacterium]|jgi:polyhydroxybutyrate depolymerase